MAADLGMAVRGEAQHHIWDENIDWWEEGMGVPSDAHPLIKSQRKTSLKPKVTQIPSLYELLQS
jgi:hypothetical protein